MHPAVIKSRDGLDLVSYCTLPSGSDRRQPGRPDEPVPMALLVHGGPWDRDRFGYNPLHQLFANRGYAVLSVNYRASTGFGKAFINAGDREWGRKMDDDLLDAVTWATRHGIADPRRIAILGASYGGYAALSALTRNPDTYACGVDIVGPSNLETFVSSFPPHWAAELAAWHKSVGNPETEEGRSLLKDRSPLFRADRIRKPLLIGHGANDPRVKQSESEQMVAALKAASIPVVYLLYPDEGHGFARPGNLISFLAATEAFLARHLGGRVEPLTHEEIGRSSMQVQEGADLIDAV